MSVPLERPGVTRYATGFTPSHRAVHGSTGSMPEVTITDDDSFERALKRFNKKCEKAGILSDLRKHRHYEKPSERRKRKMAAARRKGRRTRAY
jgi:small subunit ribosomal protein S21